MHHRMMRIPHRHVSFGYKAAALPTRAMSCVCMLHMYATHVMLVCYNLGGSFGHGYNCIPPVMALNCHA
eukprot:1074065-Amphidinium_carterae.1